VILGGAIAGMHYTGMAAAHFQPGSICGAANVVHTNWLAAIVTLLTIGILFVTLMFSSFSSNTSSMLHSLATLNGQVVKLATLDPLTELPNREMLGIRVQKAIEVADARQQIFALLHIDLDGFKSISDPTRHVDGDAALKALATRLRECVRGSDTVARLAGDEFVVLLAGLTNQQEAEARVIPLLTRMQEDLPLRNASLQVNPGIGIALYPADGHDLRTLLKNADAAMLVAKKRGHGGFRFFEASMNEAADRTALVQNAIRDALANGYLRVAYQPKFYANGALSGGEALVRLVHPQHGTIGPAEFIPIAEHSGQIIQIGYWVARETCRQLHLWDLEKLPRTKIAINLSAAQLNQADLVSNMLDIVLSQALTPDRIIFEITETVAMQDAEKSEETIHAFQDSGFDISIDDFGTGYSSLAYLQRFRAKQLKIDRFFTLSLEDAGEEGRVIVSAIISLAHALQMDVVGEGVETEMQLAQLTSLGCDEMQGFFLGKPLGAAEFGQRVLSSKNT
jgi:diguanylate cyclase (GGDEF)-like protein